MANGSIATSQLVTIVTYGKLVEMFVAFFVVVVAVKMIFNLCSNTIESNPVNVKQMATWCANKMYA